MTYAFPAATMLLGLATVTGATVWQVEWDPNETVDRVGRVVAQAASGDTIEIGPGVYSEHIPIDGKSLTLIGVNGPDQTVLEGATEITGRGGSILYAVDDYAAALRLRGLTLRDGRGTLVFGRWPRGGAVYLFRGSARCNVAWPDSIESYPGALETEKNVVADPLFCEDAPGAFEVSGLSPCRPTHSDGCGVIGGVEVGCDFDPVERTSWGKLKNLFPRGR